MLGTAAYRLRSKDEVLAVKVAVIPPLLPIHGIGNTNGFYTVPAIPYRRYSSENIVTQPLKSNDVREITSYRTNNKDYCTRCI